jgi:hypothetical protein
LLVMTIFNMIFFKLMTFNWLNCPSVYMFDL